MKHSKNNKINLKWFVFIVFVISVIFSIPTAKAEINNNNTSVLNQQLIVSLQQLITLLMQQVEEFTKQLAAQQQAINNLNNMVFQPTQSTTSTPNSATQQPVSPHFIVEISSDKDTVRNDGVDYATLVITTKLSNGQVIPDKEIKINGQVYVSSSDGMIVYLTQPTSFIPDRCNSVSSIAITITADGKVYTKSISITNIQQVSGYSGYWYGAPAVCP